MSPKWITRIAEIVLYGVFIFVDIHDIWPQSHELAILLGIIGTIALLFLQVPVTWAAISSAAVIAVGFVVYCIAGSTPPPEPWQGWLQPANEPTPPNACDGLPVHFEGAITVLIAGSAFIVP
jgi:hypothetical protein